MHNALFYLHIFARTTFLNICDYIRRTTADSTDLSTQLASYGRDLLVFSAPALRPILPLLTRVGTQIVRAIPGVLCYVNGGVVEGGKYVVDVVLGGDAGELREMWKVAGREVVGLCKVEAMGGRVGIWA